ncbi:bifunctional protein-serine/threonine kinase/phosphatase [Acidocella sp.]|uniref:bifunctional protein-serine/threonine kinase/phosphatase n=1 Tax=Acidocella sp. TaxID=50710 RepID=UPI002615A357|nr:serine/threonine-protein kinase [Acidocella sp.]
MAEPTGWSIQVTFANQGGDAVARNFYALYEGENFGAPGRGVLAVIAHAHAEGGQMLQGAQAAVQSAAHSFAEGYFGGRRTLSPCKAATLSLISVNRWLAGQKQGGAPVSLSALLLQDQRLGLVQVGACQVYRLRGGGLTPLTFPHIRLPDTAAFVPTRALGLETDLALDLAEKEAEASDIYLLVAGLTVVEGVYAALVPVAAQAGEQGLAQAVLTALAPLPGPDKSVMALTLQNLPEAEPDETVRSALAHLPIRPPPRAGDVWDGFEIGATLFRGRYTMMVAARDLRAGREVALKIPLPSMLQDEVFSAGFMREAWIGATVRSQNVAHYIEIPNERRTSLYLVMPLYHGETLEKRLNRAPLMSLPEGVGIAFRLCEAVQDLAAIEVVHRDLKPDNVMLLETGDVRLLDLGLAYLPGLDAANAARPGGTIRYMAPELLKGTPANARTEVYALAVSIYRMFSGGAFPYGQHETWPLARLRPDLPAWLGETLGKALAARPEDRFADAGAFALALQLGLRKGRDALPPRKRFVFSSLRIWQGIALLFALLFAITWLRAMK